MRRKDMMVHTSRYIVVDYEEDFAKDITHGSLAMVTGSVDHKRIPLFFSTISSK